jgi:flagellar motor switch protein FliN/FliY
MRSLGARWLEEAWCEALATCVGAMSGERCSAEVSPGPAPGDPAGTFLWEQALSVPAGARIWVAAEEASWTGIGQVVLSAAGVENAGAADLRATCQEVIQQTLGSIAFQASSIFGREVACTDGRAEGTPPAGVSWNRLAILLPGGQQGLLWVALSEELEAALAGAASAQASPDPPPQPSAAPAGQEPVPEAVRKSKTIDLLLEVELPVGVSFGRAQMRLKDVVQLTSGSIVELNRSIAEPVEVIVNNCVIARGEVVVVDGNYGVRIKEIVSRQERLRTLR